MVQIINLYQAFRRILICMCALVFATLTCSMFQHSYLWSRFLLKQTVKGKYTDYLSMQNCHASVKIWQRSKFFCRDHDQMGRLCRPCFKQFTHTTGFWRMFATLLKSKTVLRSLNGSQSLHC